MNIAKYGSITILTTVAYEIVGGHVSDGLVIKFTQTETSGEREEFIHRHSRGRVCQ